MKILLPLVLVASLSSVVYKFAVPVEKEKMMRTTVAKPESLNTLTPAEMKKGWISLFDGKTTKGWHVYMNKSDGSAWKAEDGTLTFDPTNMKDGRIVGNGDLVTDATFENYHLSLEWKISVNGNSGLIFNVQEDAKYVFTFETGPEMQVLDNNGHPDAKIIKHRAGDLYDLISCSKETVKPAMEWNKAEIKLNKGKLDLYLNGTNVVSTTMWDDNWKKLLAGSKFRNMPDFGTFKSGHFALQDHGNKVWYRNIKIKKL
jgi:hypothetical protein